MPVCERGHDGNVTTAFSQNDLMKVIPIKFIHCILNSSIEDCFGLITIVLLLTELLLSLLEDVEGDNFKFDTS